MRSTDIKAYRVNDFFAVPIITGSSSFAVKFDTGSYGMKKAGISTEEILSLV